MKEADSLLEQMFTAVNNQDLGILGKEVPGE